MNAEIANKQNAKLLNSINNASRAIDLFELLRNKKFTTGTVKKNNWLEEILLSFIILKIHTIFDKTKDTVSLEKFLKNNAQYITTKENIQNIFKIFEKIQTGHKILIDQIKNNRHEEVAHIAQKTNLGVTEEVATKIREFGQVTGNKRYLNLESVSVDKMRFSVGNFPIQEAKEVIKNLQKIIFGIKYSRTLNKDEN